MTNSSSPRGCEIRVLASQPIPISPPHRSSFSWSQQAGTNPDRGQDSIPRESQAHKAAADSTARDNRTRIDSETTEIQETPLDGDTNEPETTHSQRLATSQAQYDAETQQEYEPATPSPTRRKGYGHEAKAHDAGAHRLHNQHGRESPNSRLSSSNRGSAGIDDASTEMPYEFSQQHANVGAQIPEKFTQNSTSTSSPHDAINESQRNFEKAKSEKWEQRKQRMMRESVQPAVEAKANAASKRRNPVPEKGSRKKAKPQAAKVANVAGVDVEEDNLSRLESVSRTAPGSGLSLTGPARTPKGAVALAKLGSALPLAQKAIPTPGVRRAEKRGKLVGQLHQKANKLSQPGASADNGFQTSDNHRSLGKTALADPKPSAAIASNRKGNQANSGKSLDVFDLESEHESIPEGHRSTDATEDEGERPRNQKFLTKSDLSNSSPDRTSEASGKRVPARKSNVKSTTAGRKKRSTKAAANSSEVAWTVSSENAVEEYKTSQNTTRIDSPSRKLTQLHAKQVIQSHDQTEDSSPPRSHSPQYPASARVFATAGSTNTERKTPKSMLDHDQQELERGDEHDSGLGRSEKGESHVVISDNETSDDNPIPDDDSTDDEPVRTDHSRRELTTPDIRSVEEKGSTDRTHGHIFSRNAINAEKAILSALKSSQGMEARRHVTGDPKVIERKNQNETSAYKLDMHSKQPSNGQSLETKVQEYEMSSEAEGKMKHLSGVLRPSETVSSSFGENGSTSKPEYVPERKERGLLPSRNEEKIEKRPSNFVKQAFSTGAEKKLNLEAAPRLSPPGLSTRTSVLGSPHHQSQPFKAREHAERQKDSTGPSKPVDGHVHRKAPMVHFTAKGPMNQGTTARPLRSPSPSRDSEMIVPKKRLAGEPLEQISEPKQAKQAKRPFTTVKDTQTLAKQRDEVVPAANKKSQKRLPQSTQRSMPYLTMQNGDNGNSLPTTVDESGGSHGLSLASESEHADRPQPQEPAFAEPRSGQGQQDEHMSNAMASYCTVPTQILSQPPNFLLGNTRASLQSPPAVSQDMPSFVSERVVQQNASKADLGSPTECDSFASLYKPVPKQEDKRDGPTRFMRSLQAQIDAQIRRREEEKAQHESAEAPETTHVEGRRHNRDTESLTSDSPVSTEVEESEEDELDVERREAMEWEDALKPHQRDIVVVLSRISRQLTRHLVGTDDAVDDLVNDYERSGAELIQSMENAHMEEYGERAGELQGRKDVMRKVFRDTEGEVLRGCRDVKGLGLGKDVVNKMEESHEQVQNDLQELTNML